MGEQSHVSRVSPDPSKAFSNSFFACLFARVNLTDPVERFSEAHRASLSSDIARPGEAEQARAATSSAPACPPWPSGLERLRRALVCSCFLEVSLCFRTLGFLKCSLVFFFVAFAKVVSMFVSCPDVSQFSCGFSCSKLSRAFWTFQVFSTFLGCLVPARPRSDFEQSVLKAELRRCFQMPEKPA